MLDRERDRAGSDVGEPERAPLVADRDRPPFVVVGLVRLQRPAARERLEPRAGDRQAGVALAHEAFDGDAGMERDQSSAGSGASAAATWSCTAAP